MGNTALAVDILLTLLTKTQEIGALIAASRASGTDITNEQLAQLAATYTAAHDHLQQTIASKSGAVNS